MQRKFYIFYAPNVNPMPSIAALGFLNSKAFEDGCKANGYYFEHLTEEQAYKGLSRLGNVGCGVFIVPQGKTREEQAGAAAKACIKLSSLIPCYHVEQPIELMETRELVPA